MQRNRLLEVGVVVLAIGAVAALIGGISTLFWIRRREPKSLLADIE